MLDIEDLLVELAREDLTDKSLPPGFRFHPTDEELVTFYLASKVFNGSFCGIDIAELDLNRCEPWDLPDVARMGEREWYFFCSRDRKYPTGIRTNRATGAGYWKATGKDRGVCSAESGLLLGMKKTLVFYRGRAPRGEKTKWVMHEFRLDGDFSSRNICNDEWVICRIFHKGGGQKKAASTLYKGLSPPHFPSSLLPLEGSAITGHLYGSDESLLPAVTVGSSEPVFSQFFNLQSGAVDNLVQPLDSPPIYEVEEVFPMIRDAYKSNTLAWPTQFD